MHNHTNNAHGNTLHYALVNTDDNVLLFVSLRSCHCVRVIEFIFQISRGIMKKWLEKKCDDTNVMTRITTHNDHAEGHLVGLSCQACLCGALLLKKDANVKLHKKNGLPTLQKQANKQHTVSCSNFSIHNVTIDP